MPDDVIREVEALSDRILKLNKGQVTDEPLGTCTLFCLVTSVSETIRTKLLEISLVDTVTIQPNGFTIQCHPDARAIVASTLAKSGLLEMKRIR